jgi:hypothetical protein
MSKEHLELDVVVVCRLRIGYRTYFGSANPWWVLSSHTSGAQFIPLSKPHLPLSSRCPTPGPYYKQMQPTSVAGGADTTERPGHLSEAKRLRTTSDSPSVVAHNRLQGSEACLAGQVDWQNCTAQTSYYERAVFNLKPANRDIPEPRDSHFMPGTLQHSVLPGRWDTITAASYLCGRLRCASSIYAWIVIELPSKVIFAAW